jgi:hypothetical protein
MNPHNYSNRILNKGATGVNGAGKLGYPHIEN